MTAVGVQLDQEQLADAISLFEFMGGNMERAGRMAANATLVPARTAAKKIILSEVKLKAGEVTKGIEADKAKAKGQKARLRVGKRGRLLTRYSTNPQIRNNGIKYNLFKPPKVGRKGIRLEVTPGKKLKFEGSSNGIGQPFYMILPNKALAIAQRRRKAGKKGGKIEVFHGPSLSQVFGQIIGSKSGSRARISPQVDKIFEAKALEKMNYLLRKQYPPES